MTGSFGTMAHKYLALSCIAASVLLISPARADTIEGIYRGFLAFDHKGKDVREQMMISFHSDGTLIMGAQ